DDDHDSEDVMEHLGEEFEDDDEDDDGFEDDVQEISFIEASTDVTRGFYRWLDKAVITHHLNGSQEAVDVDASYWTDGNGLLLFLAYPNFDGGSILHDPSLRLIEGASPFTPPGGLFNLPIESYALIGITVVLIAGVGLAIKRR
ncbi:MAG: hypothetical protein ThorAB25_09090, partial [Candidatus Thorarchaeota archaeon AB_25]